MQNFDVNSTNVTEVRTKEHTNGRTDKRKDENYIPLGINAGGIIIPLGINDGGIISTYQLDSKFLLHNLVDLWLRNHHP